MTSETDFIQSLSQSVRHLVMFSDTCGGQNRNKNFSAMCLRAVKEYSIECIDHLFMESGHSQMEVDSVHSTIENACRNQDVYAPTDYYKIISMARRGQPYRVHVLNTENFHDYKALSESTMKNRNKASDGSVVKWLKVKWFRYDKECPDKIFFSYDYSGEFKALETDFGRKGRRPKTTPRLKNLYQVPPSISAAKHRDLVSLCKEKAVPSDYHSFYLGLKHDENVRDTVADTDVDDEEP